MKIKIGRLTVKVTGSISWEKSFMREVHKAIREERKLKAIKIYKVNTGKSLTESKEYIDTLWNEYFKIQEEPYMELVYAAIRQGLRVEAVKIYKDNTGKDLKEVVNYIDSIWEKYYIKPKRDGMDDLISFQARQFNK